MHLSQLVARAGLARPLSIYAVTLALATAASAQVVCSSNPDVIVSFDTQNHWIFQQITAGNVILDCTSFSYGSGGWTDVQQSVPLANNQPRCSCRRSPEL